MCAGKGCRHYATSGWFWAEYVKGESARNSWWIAVFLELHQILYPIQLYVWFLCIWLIVANRDIVDYWVGRVGINFNELWRVWVQQAYLLFAANSYWILVLGVDAICEGRHSSWCERVRVPLDVGKGDWLTAYSCVYTCIRKLSLKYEVVLL